MVLLKCGTHIPLRITTCRSFIFFFADNLSCLIQANALCAVGNEIYTMVELKRSRETSNAIRGVNMCVLMTTQGVFATETRCIHVVFVVSL